MFRLSPVFQSGDQLGGSLVDILLHPVRIDGDMSTAGHDVEALLAHILGIDKVLVGFHAEGIHQRMGSATASEDGFPIVVNMLAGLGRDNLLNRRRIQAAQVLMKETDAAVESIALQTGFIDAKSFCRAFRRSEDMTPGTFRAKFREASKTS